ncbi:hypothetical protein Hanom_Chr01g00059071 [Helianthus anomalus]
MNDTKILCSLLTQSRCAFARNFAVRKIRIIPQRKLKDTYSQQSAIYVQAGVEYIRHVSSLVKSKINKLGISSFSLSCEDALLLEVQGEKRIIQGRAVIPVSSLHDNLNDRIRWWPIYHEDNECIEKVHFSITSTVTSDESTHLMCGPVVETLAYDLLLESAMRAQSFHACNLCVVEPWKWLLTEFSDYYGVSESYTKLRMIPYVLLPDKMGRY